VILGTRGSELAMAQTAIVTNMLRSRHPDLPVEVITVRTTGDVVRDRPLGTLGFGAFVRELDARLVAGELDAAVNSLKDMPVQLTEGTELAAVLPRGPAEDVLLSEVPLDELPPGAVIGSSSARRSRQLLARRPDMVIKDLRGNVPTRVRKWRAGEYDAIVLARAGLERLGSAERYFVLDPEQFVPAPGQGAIAIVCRQGCEHLETLRSLDDPRTRSEVEAERYVLKALGGGCALPLGVWARTEGGRLRVLGSICTADGEIRAERIVAPGDTAGLDRLAAELAAGLEGP